MTQLLYWIISACQGWKRANSSPRRSSENLWLAREKSWASQRNTPDSSLWHSARHRLWLTGSSLTSAFACKKKKKKAKDCFHENYGFWLSSLACAPCLPCLFVSIYRKQRLRSSKVNINLKNHSWADVGLLPGNVGLKYQRSLGQQLFNICKSR